MDEERRRAFAAAIERVCAEYGVGVMRTRAAWNAAVDADRASGKTRPVYFLMEWPGETGEK